MSQIDEHKAPVIDLPVHGTWKLVKSPGHARFAFDLAVVGNHSYQTLSKSRLHHLLGRTGVYDSYSWSRPIYAPNAGTVVRASDGRPDRHQLSLLRDLWSMFSSRPDPQRDGLGRFAGNHVIIRGAGSYIFLAHLQRGSLQVNEGEKVKAGQPIGRVGNSGYTLEPHLHLQLFDQIDDPLAATAPRFLVSAYERWTGEHWELVRNAVLRKGELIRTLGSNDLPV